MDMQEDGRSSAEKIYEAAKDMAIAFHFKPGERINEGRLAKALNASRTPVREALNRLVAERLIDFRPGQGFFCRALQADDIYDLYQVRSILETASVRAACENATEENLITLDERLRATGLQVEGLSLRALVARDEAFHEEIARLSGNRELARQLQRLNERIRFVRWLAMENRTAETKGEHVAIMEALLHRDADKAARIMEGHITRRLDQIASDLAVGYGRLYMESGDEFADRIPVSAS